MDIQKPIQTTLNSSHKERLLRLQEVIHITGISKSQIYKLMAEKHFPQVIKITPDGGRSSGWLESEIQAFITSRISASRQGAE